MAGSTDITNIPARADVRGTAQSTASTVLDRPVDPRPPGLEQGPLPRPALLGQVGREDRSVVTGGLGAVVQKPRSGLFSKLVHLHGGRSYAAARSVR